MGCCNFNAVESEAYNDEKQAKNQESSKISFADISIQSNDHDQLGKIVNTDDVICTSGRLRSTSCNSLRQSCNMETAFLMASPMKGVSFASKSWNFKSSDTMTENTLRCF